MLTNKLSLNEDFEAPQLNSKSLFALAIILYRKKIIKYQLFLSILTFIETCIAYQVGFQLNLEWTIKKNPFWVYFFFFKCGQLGTTNQYKTLSFLLSFFPNISSSSLSLCCCFLSSDQVLLSIKY